MAKKKKKYYVVWNGRETGIFQNWDECKKQVEGFVGAIYKSFLSKELAEKAFKGESSDYIGKDIFETELTDEQLKLIGKPDINSIVVDGACSSATGIAEYKGIYLKNKQQLFYKGPFEDGTNNIVEFLAIVHALAFCKEKNIHIPIYSDSKYAISWVKDKEARTNHPRREKNRKLFILIDRAVKWLKENKYPNKILKWETKAWGENPADFGRK